MRLVNVKRLIILVINPRRRHGVNPALTARRPSRSWACGTWNPWKKTGDVWLAATQISPLQTLVSVDISGGRFEEGTSPAPNTRGGS